MDWHAHIDIYCERVEPSFWAEPLNAISNMAFFVAAAWGAYSARKEKITNPAVWFLIFLTFCIGTGSFLFHTHATVWAAIADTLPIWTFVGTYTLVCIWLVGWTASTRLAIGVFLLIALVAVLLLGNDSPAEPNAAAQAPSRFNGSEQYLPAIIAMVFFSAVTMISKHPIRYWFLAATLTFFMALGFRTFDMAICDAFPYGTHYLWHILNGLMIGLLLQALIRNVKRTLTP